MAAWYLARPNELLLDLDGASERVVRGGDRLEQFFRRRLRDAMAAGLLDVRAVFLVNSISRGNLHAYVRLGRALPIMERLIWHSWLGSDLYRARADLMRAQRGHPYPSLLIEPGPIPFRSPDAVCACDVKHDTETLSKTGGCEPWERYRGPSPWECFGAPATPPDEGARVALRPGWLDLDLIRRV